MPDYLFTDGRYYIQAVEQMDENWTLMKEGLPGVPTKAEWLERNLDTGSVVGVDPFLMPGTQFSTLKASLDRVGMRLVAVEKKTCFALRKTPFIFVFFIFEVPIDLSSHCERLLGIK